MIISIDHGNKQIKTVHCPPFTSGLKVSSTVPFGKDILKYEGDYYALSNQRIPYHRDKTEDERFFHLTLFAIAREIEALRFYSDDIIRIRMPIGLPPAHFGSLHQIFENYFTGRGVIKFDYHGNPYSIYIEDAICFPQAYAAAVTMLDRLIACPKVLIVDIGGFTADYLLMRNGAAFTTVILTPSLPGVHLLEDVPEPILPPPPSIFPSPGLEAKAVPVIILQRSRMQQNIAIIFFKSNHSPLHFLQQKTAAFQSDGSLPILINFFLYKPADITLVDCIH